MIPQRELTNGAAHMAGELKGRLEECLERDERGRLVIDTGGAFSEGAGCHTY